MKTMIDPLTPELEQRLRGILERLDALHSTWFKRPEQDAKKPYEHLVDMSCHIRSAMQLWGALPLSLDPEPSRSIRQTILDRMPPQITHVPLLATSLDYPFLKHLARATAQAARCWTLGIPALPILWQAIAACDIEPGELVALAERYFELGYPQAETIALMESIHPQLLDCLRREELPA
jgi:hypothetical protein